MESVRKYIPHRGFMKVVDRYLSVDFENSTAAIEVDLDINKPYWDKNGLFQDYWTVEMMAQSVAAFHQKQAKNKNPQVGYLIAIDEYELIRKISPEPGEKLLVNVMMDMDLLPIGIYSCEVFYDKTLISRATMKFLIEEGDRLSNGH